jgi:ParB family chromosome partitioning protein
MSTVIAQAPAPPAAPAVLTPTSETIHQLKLELLAPSPTNPRTSYDQEKLAGLAASIKSVGILQPIVVRSYNWFARNPKSSLNPTDAELSKKFEIVAGHRRFMAAKLAGMATVPAVIRSLSDSEVLDAQLIENQQRDDVTALEEGIGYRNRIELLTKEQNQPGIAPKARREDLIAQVAKRVGMSPRHVYARMKLTELIPSLQKDLADGRITTSHADELVRLCAKDQEEFADRCLYHHGSDFDEKFANSVRYVKDKIAKEYQLDLKKPPFPAEDASLVPAAGPCSTCINNSINSPLLAGTADNKATCMDRACFAKKREAFVAIEAAKQKPAAAKLEIIRVTPLHELPHSRRKETDKPKTRKEWKTAHKGECDHVQPAVVVDASGLHDQAVGAKLVCANTKCNVHFGVKPERAGLTSSRPSHQDSRPKESAAAKAKRENEEKLNAELDNAGGIALVEAILGKVKSVTQPEFELLVERILQTAEIDLAGKRFLAKHFGWNIPTNPHFDWLVSTATKMSSKLDIVGKAQLLVGITICEGIAADSYGDFERGDLEKLAKKYGLDSQAIIDKAEADVKKRYAEPPQTSAKIAPEKGAKVRRAAASETAVDGRHPHPTSKPSGSPKKSAPKKAAKKPAAKKKGGR